MLTDAQVLDCSNAPFRMRSMRADNSLSLGKALAMDIVSLHLLLGSFFGEQFEKKYQEINLFQGVDELTSFIKVQSNIRQT